MSSSLELRLEFVKNLGNLRMEYLKRFYDGSSVIERYLKGDISIHVHGIVTGVDSHMKEGCLTLNARVQDDGALGNWVNREGLSGSDNRQGFMLVWIGESLESARPVTTITRLQAFNACLVGVRKPSKITPIISNGSTLLPTPTHIPSMFSIFDRKLCSLLNLPRIQNGKFVDQIIKSSPKVVYDLADEDAQYQRNGRLPQVDCEVATDAWVYVPLYWRTEDAIEGRTFAFEPRQMLFCPTYSLISAIEWMHSKTIQRNVHIV